MKAGSNLQELEQMVRGELEIKNDFNCDSRDLAFRIKPVGEAEFFKPVIELDGTDYETSELMNNQIANKLNVPKKYFDRMVTEAPELCEQNVNHWLQEDPKRYMVRTLGNKARAFLSDRYEVIDNWDVLKAIMPALRPYKEKDDLEFEESHITDTNLYLRFTIPSLEKDIAVHTNEGDGKKVGDIIHFGLQVKNSEVGLGSVEVAPFIKRLVCLNGMVATDYGQNKKHLGRSQWDGIDRSILRQETIRQGNRAWIMTVQDSVDGMFNGPIFEEISNTFVEAQTGTKMDVPRRSIEKLTKDFDFSESESDSILEHLLGSGDKTKFWLANAVTRTATDVENVDRSMKMESQGWQIMNMKFDQWYNYATA